MMPSAATAHTKPIKKGKIWDSLREHQQRYMDLSEAAEELGVSEITYRRWVADAGGKLNRVPVFPDAQE